MGLFDSDTWKGGVAAGGGAFSGLMKPTGIPIIGGAFDHSDEDAMNELRKNQGLYNIDLPNQSDYVPENYNYAGDLTPEDAKYQQISEDPRLRSAQMSALEKMSGLATTGLSDVDQQGYMRAQSDAARIQNSGAQAAMQNAQARGVGGSGLEFAMREQANQEAAERAQTAGLAQAGDSARQRALYQQAYGQQLGSTRDQDFRANNANADIINKFNMANTQAHNQAQGRNLDARQAVGNANTMQHNQAQQYNDQLRQQRFQNQMSRAGGQAAANTGMAGGYAAQNAANTSERNGNTAAVAAVLSKGASGGGGGASASSANAGIIKKQRIADANSFDQYESQA